MADPKQILNCTYAPEELDNILSKNEELDTVHFYIDLKNCAVGLFIEDVVKELIETKNHLNGGVDSTIFQSIILTIGNWKNWAAKRKKNIKIFVTNDQGKSVYHKGILPEYKANRAVTNTTLAKYQDELNVVRHKNFELAESITNKLNDVFFFNLKFLESDFLSYYLITRTYKEQDNILHVIASNDKDHYQTLNEKNTVMFTRRAGVTKLYDKNTVLRDFVKIKSDTSIEKELELIKTISNIDPTYSPILLSFSGDTSDNVPGIKSVGNITAAKMFAEQRIVKALIGTLDDAINRVQSGGKLLDESALPFSTLGKNWQKAVRENDVITNAFRVISYEMLCKYLEEENTTNKIEMLEYIKNILEKKSIEIVTESIADKFMGMFKKIPDIRLDDSEIISVI